MLYFEKKNFFTNVRNGGFELEIVAEIIPTEALPKFIYLHNIHQPL